MILLDSNIIIYAFNPAYTKVLESLSGHSFHVSALTQIEVMGYWRLSDDDYSHFASFFALLRVIGVTPDIVEKAIVLRRKRSMGLADAVIAATALVHHMPLATHNLRDYQWIDGMELVDPIEDAAS